jgi:hypothetical protein
LRCGRAKLVRDDLWQRGPDALARLHLRHGYCDPAVARDLDEVPERLLAALHNEVAAEMARHGRTSPSSPRR